jgi:hypothetical protein
MVLKVATGGGLTSCFSTRLHDYCKHSNPKSIEQIDSSQQFNFYKDWLKNVKNKIYSDDLSKKVFDEYKQEDVKDLILPIYDHGQQYSWYNEIDIINISKLAYVVCKIHPEIYEKSVEIAKTYNLKERCGVIYRGNDKAKEIDPTPYSAMEEIAIKSNFSSFYLQTDDQNFLDFFISKFPNTVYNNNIPRIVTNYKKYVVSEDLENFAQEFIASLFSLSVNCPAVITTTGNIGIWSAIFRRDLNNFYQYHGNKKTWRKLI